MTDLNDLLSQIPMDQLARQLGVDEGTAEQAARQTAMAVDAAHTAACHARCIEIEPLAAQGVLRERQGWNRRRQQGGGAQKKNGGTQAPESSHRHEKLTPRRRHRHCA